MFGSQLCTGLQQTLVALLAGIEIQVIFYSFGGMYGGELCPEYACLLGGQIYIIYASLCQYFAVAFQTPSEVKVIQVGEEELVSKLYQSFVIIEQSESHILVHPFHFMYVGLQCAVCGNQAVHAEVGRAWSAFGGKVAAVGPVELTVVGSLADCPHYYP